MGLLPTTMAGAVKVVPRCRCRIPEGIYVLTPIAFVFSPHLLPQSSIMPAVRNPLLGNQSIGPSAAHMGGIMALAPTLLEYATATADALQTVANSHQIPFLQPIVIVSLLIFKGLIVSLKKISLHPQYKT
jgi:hypothetical protein